MHYYNGRIYVGAGDLWGDRGPIDVWSFDSAGIFHKEYTVDEEQVSIFRDYDGKLLIPGMDSRESWEYGNLYINDHGVFRGFIYSSKNLNRWSKKAEFSVGALPYSLEILDGTFYVGLGNRWGYADFESGNIYRVEADNTLVAQWRRKAKSPAASSQTSATSTALHPNYPNPFNPETWIPYQLTEDMEVKISIYDTSGNVIRALDLGYKPAGIYMARGKAAHWDGRNEAGENVASGVYFYTLHAGEFKATRKMIIAE